MHATSLHNSGGFCKDLPGLSRADFCGKWSRGRSKDVPFTTAEQLKLSLTEVPPGFVQHQVPDATPNNVLLPSLVQQLQPHRVFSGEEAPFKLQITQLSDGCALGISISHLLAGVAAQPGHMLASSVLRLLPNHRSALAVVLTSSKF